jgi:HWE histidine kinase
LPIRGADSRIIRWFGTNTDITERLKADEQRGLLINELNHRVKNTLATVQSLAMQTLRNTERSADARELFKSRLTALSRAHDVLTVESWEGAELPAGWRTGPWSRSPRRTEGCRSRGRTSG